MRSEFPEAVLFVLLHRHCPGDVAMSVWIPKHGAVSTLRLACPCGAHRTLIGTQADGHAWVARHADSGRAPTTAQVH